MEGEAIAATIEVLVQNLIDISKEEISLHQGLDNNAEKLRDTFGVIQSYLDDAHNKFIDDDAVKTWLRQLEAVAFDADNVLDEYNYKLLSQKMKEEVRPSCFPSFSHCVRRRHLAVRINGIITTFDSMKKTAVELGLERRLADAPAAAASETDSFTVDPVFTGRDGDVSEIVKKLTTPTDDEALSILPIVGMGGMGKTTLVRKVFNHENIISYFGLRIWVHVSQNFDAMLLFKKILTNLNLESTEVQSREDLLKKLREALAGKKYVLVLDDVWNEDRHKWEGFINSWSGITSTKGNGILVTTRSTEVGSIVNTLGIHHLNGLSEEECFSIIKVRVGDIPSGVEAIGRSIAERCKGLPLAANVVGGVLRHKPQQEWLSIRDNWLSNVGGDENNTISRILKLSFHHLSSPSLKKCFAFCSVFPKGCLIHKEELIELWMAQGFLQIEQENDMEIVGNKLFYHLVKSSLLQVGNRDKYENVTECSMHDLVHDVAGSVLGLAKVNENTSNQTRYISRQSHGYELSRIPKEQTKWLRTLFCNAHLSDMKLSDFKSLRELTLTGYNVKELSDSIKELIHLRYLNILFTSVESLPDSTGELYHLQTFWAPYWGSLKKLPSTFKYLFNLRHLHLPDNQRTELPPQIGKLTSLQTLSYFKVRDEEGHRIFELRCLKNLKGQLEIHNLEKVQGEEDSKRACLLQKAGIFKLVLMWSTILRREGEVNDENVLRGLKPHPNLKVLEISGFKGASFPLWMEGLTKLMEIKLERCSECEEIPSLGHLPHLKSLYLAGLRKVKSIGSSFYNFFKETIINVFPALETLVLRDMPNLVEWAQVEIPSDAQLKVFQRLQYLKIHKCESLRSAPQSEFPCLEELEIEGVDPALANIIGIQLKSLVNLQIRGLGEMVCLPDWLFHNNQNLSVFKIMDCPKLSTLPDGLQTLTCLKELVISECKNLKSIPFSQSRGSTLLRKLSVGNETGIPIPFPSEMIESCAPSLEVLNLYGSGIHISRIMGRVHKMSCLVYLEIYNVPKFIISTSPTERGSLRNLNTLRLYPDNSAAGSWDSVSFNEAANGILRLGCQSLHILELAGSEEWESLPDEIQHLTALEELRLEGFGIQELPEWFGNFSSLRELCLYDCRKLKHLASMVAMRRLTNLNRLSIAECRLLKERCKQQSGDDDDDSEWPKISHITRVYIN